MRFTSNSKSRICLTRPYKSGLINGDLVDSRTILISDILFSIWYVVCQTKYKSIVSLDASGLGKGRGFVISKSFLVCLFLTPDVMV